MKQQLSNFDLLFEPITSRHPQTVWWPAADVYRCERGWLVKFDLAGVREEDIEVGISGSSVRVSGTRRDRRIYERQETHRMEIAYSQFDRCVELPEAVTEAALRTEYRDGMLLVHVITEEKLI